jgi:hypothetical protein
MGFAPLPLGCWWRNQRSYRGPIVGRGIAGHGGRSGLLGRGIQVDEQGRIAQHQRCSTSPAFVEQLLKLQGHLSAERMAHQMHRQGGHQRLDR